MGGLRGPAGPSAMVVAPLHAGLVDLPASSVGEVGRETSLGCDRTLIRLLARVTAGCPTGAVDSPKPRIGREKASRALPGPGRGGWRRRVEPLSGLDRGDLDSTGAAR